jgi:TRAP-type C4-dicarboxylate transport system permease small subunit
MSIDDTWEKIKHWITLVIGFIIMVGSTAQITKLGLNFPYLMLFIGGALMFIYSVLALFEMV